MKRVRGIEPPRSAWESYRRGVVFVGWRTVGARSGWPMLPLAHRYEWHANGNGILPAALRSVGLGNLALGGRMGWPT
jgi:hypothetical protein